MQIDGSRPTVAIVGGGIAGLACAGALSKAGWAAQVFDKGRRPGGRASTRRVPMPAGGEVGFDHGAQYMTAHDPAFAGELNRWQAAGLAAPWPAAGDGSWVGVPGMSAPLEALAADLDVQWSTRVEALDRGADGVRLMVEGEAVEPFDAVVLALPAEQAGALATGVDDGLAMLAASRPSDPCWTVMLAFDARVPIDGPILKSDGDLPWAARNGAKPGRGPTEAWVLQASPGWSRAHLEDDPDAVIEALTEQFAERVGADLPNRLVAQAHRWRYARSARGAEGFWWNGALRLGACGDWLIGPRFENAWLSGRRLAERIVADRPSRPRS